MQTTFKAISLSYKKASVEVREKVALGDDACRNLLNKIQDILDVSDVLLLSTCNRTEVYYNSEKDLSLEFIKLIGIEKGIFNIEDYSQYFEVINNHKAAVQHLFDVSIGLKSQVVGDLQITNQVKRAYQQSADAGLSGPFLHRLMHTIFFTNKRIVQQTTFRDGAASVSYAAAELVEELTAEFVNPKILVVGLGEIGADVCRNLTNFKFSDITITNRTLKKAEELADECGFKVLPFEKVYNAIEHYDVIICSVAAPTPFISKSFVEGLKILSYKFFIDLSVPRSIEPSVEEVAGALVYNVDDIENKAAEALEKRKAAIPDVKAIIAESIVEFNSWNKEMLVSPTINKLKNALEQIRQEEVTRHLKNLTEEEAVAVEKVTKSMMQKIIKLPVLQLKAACKRGEAETLIDVLNDLFDLEKQSNKIEK